MPTRILREGILTSKRVNLLTPQAEVFYRRLMSVVDDFGRYFSDPTLLLSACYPLQIKKIDESAIEGWLAECIAASLILIYESEATGYLQMVDTRQQVRAKKSKYPEPDSKLINERLSTALHTDKQLLSKRKANALEGGGEDVVEYEGGGGTTAAPLVAKTAEPKKHSVKQVAEWMRESGLKGVTDNDPRVVTLAREGVTKSIINEAVAIAKTRPGKGDGKPIHFSYAVGIMTDLLHPRERLNSDAWWLDDNKTMAKAKELGITTIGKLKSHLISEIHEAIAQRKKGASVSRETGTDLEGWRPGDELIMPDEAAA